MYVLLKAAFPGSSKQESIGSIPASTKTLNSLYAGGDLMNAACI